MLKNITTLPMKTFLFRRRDLHRADTQAIPSKIIVSCSLSGFRAEKKVDYRSTTRGPGEAEGQRTCPEVWTKVTTRRAQQESFNKRSSAIVHRCGLHFGYEHVVPHPKHLGAAIPREHMYHMRLAHEHVSLVHGRKSPHDVCSKRALTNAPPPSSTAVAFILGMNMSFRIRNTSVPRSRANTCIICGSHTNTCRSSMSTWQRPTTWRVRLTLIVWTSAPVRKSCRNAC